MKTAEVLDQTETFETAGFDILNHVGKITQVDMPMEYGRVCLAEHLFYFVSFSFIFVFSTILSFKTIVFNSPVLNAGFHVSNTP